MITDILPDEFYMDMAKAMSEVGEGLYSVYPVRCK